MPLFSRSSRRFRRRIISVLAVSILVLLLAEFPLRRFLPLSSIGDFCTWSGFEGLSYELKPETEARFDGFGSKFSPVTVRISAQGTRDREYEVPRSGERRVLLIGDSEAFGWCVEEDETFCSVAEALLDGFEIVNGSVPGYNWCQKSIAARIRVSQFQPDYVLFHFVGNDDHPGIPFEFMRFFQGGPVRLAVIKWAKLVGLIAYVHLARPELVHGRLPAEEIDREWSETLAFLGEYGIGAAVLLREGETESSVVQGILDVGREFGVDVVQIPRLDAPEYRCGKDPHYSAVAHREIGKVIASFLIEKTPWPTNMTHQYASFSPLRE